MMRMTMMTRQFHGKVYIPNPNKIPITCCLGIETIDRLKQTNVDEIVKEFKLEFNDVMYFLKYIHEESIIQKIKRFFNTPKPRQFVTIKVNKETYNRIEGLRKFYGLTKSQVLRYILNKYAVYSKTN